MLCTYIPSHAKFSLRAKFQKAASFLVRLTQKVAKVVYVHMTGKYP